MQSPKLLHRKNSFHLVELYRRPGGFGFTLSSQGPCVLSCILAGSPAHKAGLQPGDQIIEVNGTSVERTPHEHVVKLIARSPNGMVKLGVRNRAEPHRQPKEAGNTDCDSPEEAAINETILNRVDKVVEELRSGQLFGDSPSLRQSFSNGKFISEEEIVSDEELKASFSESIRSESSVQSSSPAQSYSSDRRSNDGDNRSVLSTPKLSRLLYPAMTPLQSAVSGASSDIDLEPELRAIVGYLGSIELPAASSLPTASLNAIRNCVRRLRAQQKVHIFFVMEISLVGIRLLDSEKRTVVTYPLRSLAFTGLCSDDKRVFGIVTRKANEAASSGSTSNSNNTPNSWHSHNHKVDEQSTINCSCHVFSVDPELSSHELHERIADKYGVQCTTRKNGSGCIEFPSSSSPILRTITGMFKERTGSESGGASSDGEAYLRGRSVSLSSSQSESDAVVKQSCPEDASGKARDGVDDNLTYAQEVLQSVKQEKHFQNHHVTVTTAQNQEVTPLIDQHRASERNDSGVGSDSFHHNDAMLQGNDVGVSAPPIVNVSSFHSRESSADSQLSMGSHHSSNAGAMLDSRVPRKPGPNSAVYEMGTNDPSLSNSQESLAHSDIVVGRSSTQKPLNNSASISSSTQSIHSLGSMPGDMSQLDGRVARWALGFDKLMEDPAGLGCFKEFLKKEFSDENIVFWISCENFRSITGFEELKVEAGNIFHNHLAANAPMPVNIDSCAVKDAEEQLQNPNNDMFRLQQQQVYTLMKFDSYPRFLKSDVYRQCLVAEMEGMPLPGEEGEEVRESKGKGFFKKVPAFLYASSEESEMSSSSSRSSFSIEAQRSGRGWGSKHGSKRSAGAPDGDKKKSFLPWKGKHVRKGDRSFGSQPGSARSSLSSLSDSIHNISYSSESLHVDQRRESESFQFCRVVLADHSSTILLCKEGQTLRQALLHLCERRQLSFVAHEVYLGGADKLVPLEELDEDMAIMGGREVVLEHRTLFRLELPDGVTLFVKVKPNQSVRACLEPILTRQGLSFDHVIIHLAGCEVPLGSGIPAASIEHQLVVVETAEQSAGSGNVHSQGSPRVVGKPPFVPRTSSRRGSKKTSVDDIAFEEVMRGKRQTLGSGYFDDTGVWVSTMTPSRSAESLGDLNRGEGGSFGKSLLKGQGLFGRKRREGSEQDKIAPVVVKSGRFGNEKPSDVKDFFELISRAQGRRMDDQRGELKGNLDLPDFLKLPTENMSAHSNGKSNIPDVPPPPPLIRTVDKTPTRPVVKKSLSTPAHLDEQMDFMQELAAKLSKRTGSVKNNLVHSKDNSERRERNEVLLDFNFNARGQQPGQVQHRRPDVNAEENNRNEARPRSATDAVVYKVGTMPPGIKSETENYPAQPGTDLRKNVAHVHPSVRPQVTQPVTVNSLRGMHHYNTNPRRNTGDNTTYSRVNNVAAMKPQTLTKFQSKSSQSLRDHAPAIYDVKPGSMSADLNDDSMKISSGAVNIPPRKSISAYSLPEVNSQKAEIHIPSQGPPPVPRRQVFNADRRARPKAVANPEDLIAGLDNKPATRVSTSPSSDKVSTSPNSDTRVESPLPPPPTPPSGSMYDLRIADFSPPPPLRESPNQATQTHEVSVTGPSNVTQTSSQNRQFSEGRVNDVGSPNFTGPVARVSLPSADTRTSQTQRTGEHRTPGYDKQSMPPHVRGGNMKVSNWTNSTQRGKGEDRVDASPIHPQRTSELNNSVTPTFSNLNKTVTPPSTNERTLVEDPSSEHVTPYAGHRPSMDSAAKRLVTNPASASKTRSRDPDKRRSRQEIPKLDPYVTYENEDLRITFV